MTGSEIAVIGMAARVPGARNIAEFWRNLRAGVESIRVLSHAELLQAGETQEHLDDPAYVKALASLDDADRFDAGFFGFSPQDAAIMDPQHRILLEVAWEALENAGHSPDSRHASVGVFAACGMNNYMMHNLVRNRRIMSTVGEWLVRHTGNDMNFLATRLSYQMNLRGPSMNVQTACSSTLVAIHLAAQSLLAGECDMALAGGSVLNSIHRRGYLYKPGEILSPDGHCRPFDHRAAGTVFGSGAGVVVLRRLSEAIAGRDRIAAVILGSAVNNDGSGKAGYLAPGVDGQSRVILEALAASGAPADSIAMVEAHGTGTLLGDPIEVEALTRAYRRSTARKGYCALGSVKSNIGHLGEAAGVVAFIKAVLALQHRVIPPTLHFEKPNPQIELAASPFFVNAQSREWPGWDAPRRAAVTALGAGGTNSHVVLEEAPEPAPAAESRPYQLLTLSAVDAKALQAASTALAAHLTGDAATSLDDAAFTLNLGRKALPYRRAVVARDRAEAIAALQAEAARAGAAPEQKCGPPPEVAFLFPGQGSQYPGMAKELYRSFATFAATVDECAEILKPELGADLRQVIWGAPAQAGGLHATRLAQPALFTIEYALAKLWMSWRVKPRAMIGHSVGEYVAACLAGVFSLDDGLRLVAARGMLMQRMPPGAMLAVALPAKEALLRMNGHASAGTLSLAAVNAPALSVVAGRPDQIEEFALQLAENGVEHRRLKTSHAFHSAMMDPVLEPFRERLRRVTLRPPQIGWISNLTGAYITGGEATDPDYWVRHLRNPVQFGAGLSVLLEEPRQILLEVGPGRTLAALARQQAVKPTGIVTSLPHPEEQLSDRKHLLAACGELWTAGVPLDWEAFWAHETRSRVELPSYPFQRQSYWIEPDAAAPEVMHPEPPAAASGGPAAIEPAEEINGIDRCFYQRCWHKAPASPSARQRRTWLVFADETGLGDALARRITGAPPAAAPLRLHPVRAGDIDSLAWVEDAVAQPGEGHVRIEVRACGLNFADVLKATGDFPEAPFGMECAGIVTTAGPGAAGWKPGDEVVAIGPGSFAAHVIRDARMLVRKPAGLSFEQAATLPAAYMTAWHALVQVARIQPGERVLIHAASGGVGLAAIEIAQRRGAEIFATAGNEEKRAYLRARGIRHVFGSRTLDFAHQIPGGVDVVLNSLTGAFIPASLALLRPGGRFLEIGKKEILSAEQIPETVRYFPLDLVRMRNQDPGAYGALLREVVDLVCAGDLRPLPVRVFSRDDAAGAFNYMLQTRHIGKVALSLEPAPAEVYTVRAGSRFERIAEREFRLRPAAAEDYRELLAAMGAAAARIDAVAHLWNVTAGNVTAGNVTAGNVTAGNVTAGSATKGAVTGWERHLEKGFSSLIGLAKSLARLDTPRPVELRVVSNRLYDIAGETEVEPSKAMIEGPCRVIPREFENLICSSVDIELPRGGMERERLLDQLAAEFGCSPDGRSVAYRGADRWVESIERVPCPVARTVFRRGGVYLITGGMGGLGMELAEHLAKTFQARLVLVGRRLPDAGKLERIKAWQACGAEVRICRADVTDARQMRRAIREAAEAFGPMEGVFHAAGVLDDGLIALKDPGALWAVMAPKVQGALVLEELFRKTPLDFLVLFSSVASVVGLQGQVDYTAANAFLDAFACRQAKQGRRVVAIGWGAWKEAGMAAAAARERVQRIRLSGQQDWMLAEHMLDGRHVLPGTGYLELIRSVYEAEQRPPAIEISDVVFNAPLILQPEETVELVLSRRSDSSFTIRSRETHVTGRIASIDAPAAERLDLASIRARCPRREDFPDGYPRQKFIQFGPRWSNLRTIHFGSEEALIELELPQPFQADLNRFRLHPALLDLATGGAQALIPGFDAARDNYVPFCYGRLELRRGLPAHLFSHVRLKGPAAFDVTLLDEAGEVAAEITGFVMRPLRDRAWLAPPRETCEIPTQAGISPQEGLEALERILGSRGAPHLLACARDVNAWLRELDQSAGPDRVAAAHPSPTGTELGRTEQRLAEMWSNILGVADIKPQDDFFALGGHSLLLLRLAARIQREFHKTIPMSTLFQSPTIEKISALLGEEAPPHAPCIVSFQDNRHGPAFFCVHSVGGEVMCYKHLRKWMAPDVRLYGIQLPPEWRGSEATASIEAMARRYVEELLQFEPQGPYVLGGWSAGSPVALEMAQQLETRGHRVSLLVALDGAPFHTGGGLSRWNPLYTAKLARNLPRWLSETLSRKRVVADLCYRAGKKLKGRWDSLTARWRGDTELSKYTIRGFLGAHFQETDIVFMESFFDALDRYRARPYSGRVLLYEAQTQPLHHLLQTGAAWKNLATQLEIVPAKGSHVSMVEEPYVRALAEHLSRTLLDLT